MPSEPAVSDEERPIDEQDPGLGMAEGEKKVQYFFCYFLVFNI